MSKQNQTAVANIFDVGAPKTVAAPKKSKKVKAEIQLEKLDLIASLKVMEKTFENECQIHMAEAKEVSLEAMVEFCHSTKLPPESLMGTGERSTASVEIRRKGTNSPLTSDAVKALTEAGVEFDNNVTVPARFVMNPDLSQDILLKISMAIMKDPTLRAIHEVTPIIQRQEEVSINVASEETIRQIAKLNDKDQVRELLKVTTTLAIGKFNFDGDKIEQDKSVTVEAKAVAIGILQTAGVLPSNETIDRKRKKKAPAAE